MDTIRAWKDPEYRKSLDASALPQHPSGAITLDDSALDEVAGGTATAAICVSASIVLTVTLCSNKGSCGFFTAGCC